MPELMNAAWEASAQGHARGLTQQEACIAAGYSAKSRSAPSRVFRRECVKARVAELVKQRGSLRAANLEETILAMLELAAKTDLATAAGVKEARAARLEAHRLNGLLAARREAEAWTPPREMTEADGVGREIRSRRTGDGVLGVGLRFREGGDTRRAQLLGGPDSFRSTPP